ncbi:MAG: hypothetical protein VCD34_04915 [Planctomycetota bacterium]
MSEDKVNDDLYRRVEEHLQELIEPDLPEAKLSPAERLELLEEARASEPCRELLESYEKTVSLLGSRPDAAVPADFSRQVGESIDDSTPVIPFVRTEKFQRLLGAAAAVALMTLVVWRSVTPPAQEPFSELAVNDPLGEPELEFAADEPLAKPRAGKFSREKALAPGTQELDSAAEAEEEAADPAPDAVEIADAAPVSDPGTIAPAAEVAEVVAANKAQSQETSSPIEVSRESVDGQLVAVRYEVAVPRSRLAELKAWQARRGVVRPFTAASRAASEDALKGKSRARQAPAPGGSAKDKSVVQDGGKPSGEFLALVVDAGKLESLRLELAALQVASPERDRAALRGNDLRADRPEGVAKRSAKTLRKAAPAAAEAKAARSREASPAPGVSERALRRAAPAKVKKAANREPGAGLKEDLPGGSDPQAKLANRQLGAATKAAPAGKAQVRVEIRFRIVPD